MLSPEALAEGDGPSRAYHGRPADVWAAGATLYALLFGRLPFASKDAVGGLFSFL